MPITPGRASASYQTLASSYEVAFRADSAGGSNGSPATGIRLVAADQPALVKVWGVLDYGADLVNEYLIDTGESIDLFASGPRGQGRITRIDAKYSVSGSKLKWCVISR
ncbi:MAG: hypothetical protein IT469_01665 [Pseudomonadales bacterium]|nr:hypothetical protein [Pseudomonadales bacterium]